MRISDWSSDVCSSDLVVHWQGQFAPIHQVKHLPPRIPIRPFGDPDKSHVLNAHFLQNTAHGIQLPTATVDQHQIGPVTLPPPRTSLCAPTTPPSHGQTSVREKGGQVA